MNETQLISLRSFVRFGIKGVLYVDGATFTMVVHTNKKRIASTSSYGIK